MEKCDCCDEEAGVSEFNATGILTCQTCGDSLCDMCTVYGFDHLPRCEGCHFKHTAICYECKGGDKEKNDCDYCDYS